MAERPLKDRLNSAKTKAGQSGILQHRDDIQEIKGILDKEESRLTSQPKKKEATVPGTTTPKPKAPVKPKPLSKKEQRRQQALKDIAEYNRKYRSGKKTDDRPLSTLTGYGRDDSTATSGGSQAVRKVTADDTRKAQTPDATDLVERLRKNRPGYIKK